MAKQGNPWGLYDPRAPYNVSTVSYYSSARDQWILSNGSYGWDDGNIELRHRSTRPRYETSPITVISGTSSKWRKATDYSRCIYNQVTTQKLRYLRRLTTGESTGEYRETPLPTTAFSPSEARFGAEWRLFHSTNENGFDHPDLSNATDRATTECLLKLGGNKVDLGTALAESVKTVNHLATTAVDIAKAYSALRGRRWRDMLNILSKRHPLHSRKIVPGKTAAQYWLEYNYAWKPLFYEAYGFVELLRTQLEPAMLVHASRTVHGTLAREVPLNPNGVGTGLWYGIHYSASCRVKYETCVRLTGRINSTGLRRAALGLTNPAAVAWELVPYSFVVDWAIPIGNVLEAATATRGLTFVGGSRTRRYFASARVHYTGKSYHTVLREGEAEVYKFHMARGKYSGFPAPVPYTKSPFSSSHTLSALALLRQIF